MSAVSPGKRRLPARVLAERLGVSQRTVQRLVAQPRDEYVQEQRELREAILRAREEGKSWVDIGEQFDITPDAARMRGKRAKTEREAAAERPGESSAAA